MASTENEDVELDHKAANNTLSDAKIEGSRDNLQWRNLYKDERFELSTLFYQHKLHKVVQWRIKERMKTVSITLTLCLNIGVDPPDALKTNPCARLECWIDPLSLSPQKALETIGRTLQTQYEFWQPRARHKQCLDPTIDEVKKVCTSLRRNAKEDRVLFHYNGHGVPKVTQNGEIWVFNKNYTQYIPLSLYELQLWVGSPSVYVFDCSAAGLILNWFNKNADQKEQEVEKQKKKEPQTTSGTPPSSTAHSLGSSGTATPSPPLSGPIPLPPVVPNIRDYIMFCACAANEVLPMSPEMPADLFTACLTTPVKTALKWFCTQSKMSTVSPELIDKIPGHLTERRTPFGELNWIFTTITDTIAWNLLSPDLFQRLFRQDLLVASLFRNFLLAERILRVCKCTPISYPRLPPSFNHQMWQSWDFAAEHCLSQLSSILSDPSYEYQHSSFFTEQLTAFEVWLEFGTEERKPPEQLPIILQVLLSQQHRRRSLELLSRFLDLGPWAVNQALSVGIFPYILKLLQGPSVELRKMLVFIWAKILTLDQSCQTDLVKEGGHLYFVSNLVNSMIPIDELIQSTFILATICHNFRPGQTACLNAKLIQICLPHLSHVNPTLRRHVVLVMAKLWENYEEAKTEAIKENVHEKLCSLLSDPVPEVRAATVYALGTFIGHSGNPPAHKNRSIIEYRLGFTFAVVMADSSPLVRKELVIALAALVNAYDEKFKNVEKAAMKLLEVAASEAKEKKKKVAPNDTEGSFKNMAEPEEMEGNGIYEFLWKLVVSLSNDPYPLIAQMATTLVKKIRDLAAEDLKPPLVTVQPKSNPNASSPSFSPLQVSLDDSTTSKSTSFKSPRTKKTLGFFGGSTLNSPASPVRSSQGRLSGQFPVEQRMKVEDLRSTLYEWSGRIFSEPVMHRFDEDQTAPAYNERKWRIRRNEGLVREAKNINGEAQNLENEIAILENENQVISHLHFHPFESVVLVADEHDTISVWNWEGGQLIMRFTNQNPPTTRVTALDLINVFDNTMVVVGSDDGIVRVWGGFYRHETLRLVTAWHALPIEGGNTSGAGLVLDWQQRNGIVVSSGNVNVLKVWDVNRELFLQDIPTNSTNPVTCLTSDKSEGERLIVAGCWDGSVRLFDRRVGSKYGPVAVFSEHKRLIINTTMPSSLYRQIISGSAAGDIRFWDLRNTQTPVKSFETARKGENVLTAMAIHHYAPIIAVGQDQRIKVMNFNGDGISLIRYHDGFLGQRIGPVSSLSFHPYKVMMGAGATDSIVSIYAADPGKSKE